MVHEHIVSRRHRPEHREAAHRLARGCARPASTTGPAVRATLGRCRHGARVPRTHSRAAARLDARRRDPPAPAEGGGAAATKLDCALLLRDGRGRAGPRRARGCAAVARPCRRPATGVRPRCDSARRRRDAARRSGEYDRTVPRRCPPGHHLLPLVLRARRMRCNDAIPPRSGVRSRISPATARRPAPRSPTQPS